MRRAGNASRKGQRRDTNKDLVWGDLTDRDNLEDLDVGGRIIL
jgi:hypothetical protein